jgi:hypothetical protein
MNMRFAAALLAVAVLSACAKKEEASPDSAAPAVAAAMPTLADFAGTWNVASVLEGTPDTVKSTLTGAADGTWSMTLEGRPNVPVTASISGDSLITQSAEYESVLRKGVMVTVRTAGVKSGDMLMGNLVATYKTASGEQVVNGTFNATKAP